MDSFEDNTPLHHTDESRTELPGLRTWGAVYLAVLCHFVAWVALLAFFSRHFA